MAPSGTVEVCRGPAAPRDASGAEVCVRPACVGAWRSIASRPTRGSLQLYPVRYRHDHVIVFSRCAHS